MIVTFYDSDTSVLAEISSADSWELSGNFIVLRGEEFDMVRMISEDQTVVIKKSEEKF